MTCKSVRNIENKMTRCLLFNAQNHWNSYEKCAVPYFSTIQITMKEICWYPIILQQNNSENCFDVQKHKSLIFQPPSAGQLCYCLLEESAWTLEFTQCSIASNAQQSCVPATAPKSILERLKINSWRSVRSPREVLERSPGGFPRVLVVDFKSFGDVFGDSERVWRIFVSRRSPFQCWNRSSLMPPLRMI